MTLRGNVTLLPIVTAVASAGALLMGAAIASSLYQVTRAPIDSEACADARASAPPESDFQWCILLSNSRLINTTITVRILATAFGPLIWILPMTTIIYFFILGVLAIVCCEGQRKALGKDDDDSCAGCACACIMYYFIVVALAFAVYIVMSFTLFGLGSAGLGGCAMLSIWVSRSMYEYIDTRDSGTCVTWCLQYITCCRCLPPIRSPTVMALE